MQLLSNAILNRRDLYMSQLLINGAIFRPAVKGSKSASAQRCE
jgi:hypothetical protein